jgi:hypothetical protein
LTKLPGMYKVYDTAAPLAHFAKNGFYTVGEHAFSAKLTAVQYASRTNEPIKWNFLDDAYVSMDWRTPLRTPLRELYRIRAQQLRDKYDYLILFYSGGGDSHNVLQSFIKNNIKLDEIIVTWPITQSQGKYTPSTDVTPTNFISEWDFSLKPKLDWINANCPDIKITIVDIMTNLADEDSEDTMIIQPKYSYAAIRRIRDQDKILKQRYEQHPNLAVITGTGPPDLVTIKKQWLALQFNDEMINSVTKSDYLSDGWIRNIEFFYCTPDFPEILREQSHVILDYLNVNPTAIDFFESHELGGKQPLLKTFNGIPAREQQRRFIKSLIYPDWDAKTFQTIKGDDFYNKSEMFHWFYKNPESENYLHAWRSNVQSQLAIITPRLLTLAASGVKRMVSFYSQHYIIGKLTKNETI